MANDIQDLVQQILERVVRMETKLDDYKDYMGKTERALNLSENNKERLEKLEGNTTWLWRTIAGAIILGVIGSIIVFK